MSSWLDSHCHINGKEYDEDLNEVLDRMIENDVRKCMIISIYPEEYEKSLDIKKEGIDFKRALGVYPEDAQIDEERFKDYTKHFNAVDAIGEIGLDYHWNKEFKDKQKEYFIKQIKMAKELNKPIIVHARDAIQDTYDILKKFQTKGVLHCYSGSAEMAKEFVKLGYYISIAGTVTFKNAKEPLEVAKAIPLDHLLIETDAPYLTPVPHRGQRNEPSYVVHTGKFIADNLGIDYETFKRQINENYDCLLNK